MRETAEGGTTGGGNPEFEEADRSRNGDGGIEPRPTLDTSRPSKTIERNIIE